MGAPFKKEVQEDAQKLEFTQPRYTLNEKTARSSRRRTPGSSLKAPSGRTGR